MDFKKLVSTIYFLIIGMSDYHIAELDEHWLIQSIKYGLYHQGTVMEQWTEWITMKTYLKVSLLQFLEYLLFVIYRVFFFFSFLFHFIEVKLAYKVVIYWQCVTWWLAVHFRCERIPQSNNRAPHLSPHIFTFFLWWEHWRSTLLANFNDMIQYNITNYSHQVLHWLLKLYLTYNRKFVPF